MLCDKKQRSRKPTALFFFVRLPCRELPPGRPCSMAYNQMLFVYQLIFATILGTRARITAAMAVKIISGSIYMPLYTAL